VLDLKLIRSDPERVKEALARRGAAERVDELLALDARRRELLPEVESAQAERNALSRRIGEARQAGGDAAELMAAAQALKERIDAGEEELETIEAKLDLVAATLPNLPDPDSPDGMSEEDAVVLRVVGEPPALDFEPRDHLEIGSELGLIDIESAARLSGARFAYLMGDLVLVELALVRFAMELARAEGHEPVAPPALVREEALEGTGFLPGDRDQIYEIPRDELFLAGTSEVALAGLHADEILDADALPLRYCGFSSCFRREAGAAGRDTRGIFRVHQFDKVEMFSFVEPGDSAAEHERLLAIEERILGEGGQRGRRRPRRSRREEVRLRGLDPQPGPLPRADVLLQHDRLPGAAAWLPLPAGGGGGAGPGSHFERDRDRDRANDRRPDREPPGAGRRIHAT
jgi:seryl-tRNA synthetase